MSSLPVAKVYGTRLAHDESSRVRLNLGRRASVLCSDKRGRCRWRAAFCPRVSWDLRNDTGTVVAPPKITEKALCSVLVWRWGEPAVIFDAMSHSPRHQPAVAFVDLYFLI